MQESPEKRGSILGGKRVVGLKRSVGSIIRRSARESMLFPEEVQVQQNGQLIYFSLKKKNSKFSKN